MQIKVGIVGFGFIGHMTVLELKPLPQYNIIAICDLDPEKMKDAPEGVRKYDDVDKMLEAEPDIDTIFVCCNNNQHYKIVTKAARAHRHIMCEKPAAMSVEEFDSMLQVVEENGVSFTVHHQRRLDKDFRCIKEIFDKKLVGEAYTIQSALYGYNGNLHDWHVDPDEGGGMMYDWGVHLIDQMLWMIPGKLRTIYADIRNVVNKNVDDFFKLQFRFENGICTEIELGTYFLSDKENWFTRHWFIGGIKGSAYCDGFDPQGQIVSTTRLLTNVSGSKPMGAEGPTRSFGTPEPGLITTEGLPKNEFNYQMYYENYLAAREGREEFLVKTPEVRRVLQVMEACRASAKLGHSVAFEM